MENYFNYFTEVEDCFRRHRGTPSLLSTLDWAMVESWKEAGIPLEAVCAGIERTFEKYARRPRRFKKVNGLAYCSQEVMLAADAAATAAIERGTAGGKGRQDAPPFAPGQITGFLADCAIALEKAAERTRAEGNDVIAGDLCQNANALRDAAAKDGEKWLDDLEPLERTLTAIEDRVSASLARGTSVDLLVLMREEVDRSLASCRRTMTAAQIELVERQFLKKRLFEHYQLPRLSLFYM